MLSKGFLKPRISIENLGKRRFWTGILFGFSFSVVLSSVLSYSSESFRVFTFMGDFLLLSEEESRWYDLFFATFATSLAFGFTIIYWLTGKNTKIKKRYLAYFAISNSWMFIIIPLMIVSRFGSILPFILYVNYGYDGHLDLMREFWLMFLLIPIYIFFVHWNTIRLIFRTRFWVLASIGVYFLVSFYVSKTSMANQDFLNQKYYLINRNRLDFINSEVEKAGKMGVHIGDETVQILNKVYAESKIELLSNLKEAFHTDEVVSLDKMILEKIVLQQINRYGIYIYGNYMEGEGNWKFALPEDVYYQIMLHEVDSRETEILFDILAEQMSIFAPPNKEGEQWGETMRLQRKRLGYNRYLIITTKTIQSRLIQVYDALITDNQYEKYHHVLPEMEFEESRRQEFYDLQLKDRSVSESIIDQAEE